MSASALLLGLLALAPGAATPAGAPGADHAEAPEWTVRLDASTATSGEASVARVHLASRAGFHVNLEYPMSFRPAPGSGGGFREARLALRPASQEQCQGRPQESCAVTAELPFVAPGGSEVRLAGTIAFSVCSADRCLIRKVPLVAVRERPSAHRVDAAMDRGGR